MYRDSWHGWFSRHGEWSHTEPVSRCRSSVHGDGVSRHSGGSGRVAARSGQPCVVADATLTLALPKVGLRRAPEVVGDLFAADISVPPVVYERLRVPVDAPSQPARSSASPEGRWLAAVPRPARRTSVTAPRWRGRSRQVCSRPGATVAPTDVEELTMIVTVVYFEGCAHWRTADERLRALADECGFDVDRPSDTTGLPARLRIGTDPGHPPGSSATRETPSVRHPRACR